MKTGGFTLVELMVVLAIMSIMLLIAAPSMRDVIKNNRLLAESYAIRATLNSARSEAMSRRMSTIVCESENLTTCASSTNAWSKGYLAFVDADGDGLPDADEIFAKHLTEIPDISLSFRDFGGNARSSLRFSPRGDAIGNSGTATLCDDRGATVAKALIVTSAGQIRSAIDSDDSGKVDTVNASGGLLDVSC
ncbi:MAG: GspH/FimT family pseudopilin [Pseudomonadota bacterium]